MKPLLMGSGLSINYRDHSRLLSLWQFRNYITTPYRAVRFPEITHMLVSDNPEKITKKISKVLCA